MENIQKFRKKGKKLGEYMMTKLRLLRDQKTSLLLHHS